jgi:triosephosphate isomerase (TIM)
MRRKLVVGNWKLNGSLQANAALMSALAGRITRHSGVSCAVCVPSIYLAQVAAHAQASGGSIEVGGQDASRHALGAFTGEVAAAMLAECGARYCIAGHSERRALFGDSDAVVAEKFGRIKAAGIMPILCVGETLAEREAGTTDEVVLRQLRAVMAAQGAQAVAEAVVAYEPVWAIGTGRTATQEQAQAVHAVIRNCLVGEAGELAQSTPILYGGSVKASNAAGLFAMPDVDGGLVGGASLIAEEFAGIWDAMCARMGQ